VGLPVPLTDTRGVEVGLRVLADGLDLAVARGWNAFDAACTLAALADYPWITGRPGSPLAAQWQALFGAHPPAAPIACGSVMTIRELLIATDCLTLLSPDQVKVELAAGLLTALDLPLPLPPRSIGVVLRDGWRPSPVQRDFLARIAQVAGITTT
jgi:DNA-binding transcriptional LysR family regulator